MRLARLALQLKRHGVGPARVSLSNRQPLIERAILRDASALERLAHTFSKARRLTGIPELLGVEGHPELVGVRGKASTLVRLLSHILYRSDLTSLFYSLREVAGRAERERKVEEKAKLKYLPKKDVPTEDLVVQEAIREHFRELAQKNCVYSIPISGSLEVMALENFLDDTESRAKRRKLLGAPVGHHEELVADVEDHASTSNSGAVGMLFFKPIILAPSNKKTLPVTPARPFFMF